MTSADRRPSTLLTQRLVELAEQAQFGWSDDAMSWSAVEGPVDNERCPDCHQYQRLCDCAL